MPLSRSSLCRYKCIIHKIAEAFVHSVPPCAYSTDVRPAFYSHIIELYTADVDRLPRGPTLCANSNNIVFYCNIIIVTCRIVYLHLSRPPASICVHILYLLQAVCFVVE